MTESLERFAFICASGRLATPRLGESIEDMSALQSPRKSSTVSPSNQTTYGHTCVEHAPGAQRAIRRVVSYFAERGERHRLPQHEAVFCAGVNEIGKVCAIARAARRHPRRRSMASSLSPVIAGPAMRTVANPRAIHAPIGRLSPGWPEWLRPFASQMRRERPNHRSGDNSDPRHQAQRD
jgi:hypothetical protein